MIQNEITSICILVFNFALLDFIHGFLFIILIQIHCLIYLDISSFMFVNCCCSSQLQCLILYIPRPAEVAGID
jgi:hypothetical protein